MADHYAKKMTSRGVSYATITDEDYPLFKVRQKPDELPPRFVGKSEADSLWTSCPWHREMLNIPGVRHVFLESRDDTQPAVHVMYDDENSDFVHQELTVELEKRLEPRMVDTRPADNSWLIETSLDFFRSGLASIARVLSRGISNLLRPLTLEHSSKPSIIIVVCNGFYDNYGLYLGQDQWRKSKWGAVLRQLVNAVARDEQSARHVLFIHNGRTHDSSRFGFCDSLLHRNLQLFNFVVYPKTTVNQRERFLETLVSWTGDPHMEPARRAMLNEFGLIQHDVLQSPDHNTVHVIYGHTNRHFVHRELTEELKTRAGLQLVPPQSRVATLSSTADSVLIVIVDRHDSVTDRLLREAVETSEHEETHTLFIKKGRCPDWLETKLLRGTPIAYPESEWEIESNVRLRMRPVSSVGSVDRALFWDNVSTVIGERLSLLHRRYVMSVDALRQISIRCPRDKSAHKDVKVEISSFREKKADSSHVTQASEKNNVHIHEKTKRSSEKASDGAEDNDDMYVKRDAVEIALHSSQGSDKMVSSKSNPDGDEGHQIHVPPCASLKYSDRERVAESPSDADTVDTSNGMSSKEEQDLTKQGACRIDGSNENPPPIVSKSWQHKGTFGHAGGMLRKPGSDVILHVPTQALGPDNPVVIHTAVCADIDHVHTVLELAEEEQIVSPLAEYWAGPDFSFQRPVCITLPLCLPPDPDLSLLRVYRVSRRHDGHVTLTRIKRQENNLTDCPSTQQDSSNAHSVAGESYVLCKDMEKTEAADTESDCFDQRSIPMDNKFQHSEGQRQKVGYAWEESGHYEVSSEGQVLVTTNHFCGYVCVYCGRSQGPPELVAMVYGYHKRMSSLQRLASVDLYIWDKRVDIGDFRQEYDIGLTGSKVGRTAVSLLDEVKDTQLHAQIEPLGPASSSWTHLMRPDGRPGNPKVQNRDVKMIVSCDAYGCTRKKSAPPSLIQWRFVAPVDLVTDTSLFAVLDLAHVMDDAVPAWTNRNNVERITSLQIHMPESRGNEDVNEPEGHNLQLSLAALSTDQLQMVLERVDFASCQRLQQTTHRFKREEDYKKRLMELICHQDSTTVGKVIASLLPCAPGHGPASLNLQSPLGNCSPATTPANGGPHNREISPSAGLSLPNGSLESQMASTRVSDGSDWNCSDHDKYNKTSESGDVIKGSMSVPGEELILWQDRNHTLPLLPSNINTNGKESSGTGIIEKAVRESHITADQDGNYSGYMVQACARSFSGIPLSQVNCLNRPQDSQLTLTGSKDVKDDAIFDHVDKDIIVHVATNLPVDKAMVFFLDLGLPSQQYEAAKHKHGTACEQVNTECFIMLGKAGKKIDVDTLKKALATIDRFDIIQDVQKIEDRNKSKMRSSQETGPGKTQTDLNTTERPATT